MSRGSRRASGAPPGGIGPGTISVDDATDRGSAYLVGPRRGDATREEVEAHLAELAALVDTAGFAHAGDAVLPVRRVNPATLIGAGQAKDVGVMARGLDASVVVVDDDLSPAQARNLEKIMELPVVDRAGVIIDIFAQRARSREARTQVELARLEYLLPRLAGRWTHLSRQVGGGPGGTKGEGEKQIELDRRMIRARIDRLKRELGRVDRARGVRRAARGRMPQAALVGYTNVGKSSLFNRLSGANAHVENRLFATLDPTVRRVDLGARGTFLVKDTVGFIRKLPHHLVASFRSTFQEAAESDLVLVVVDASHPAFDEQLATTLKTLDRSELGDKPRAVILNKSDRLDAVTRLTLAARHPDASLVSARTGDGLEALSQRLADLLLGRMETATFEIPAARSDLVAAARRAGRVTSVDQNGASMLVTVEASGTQLARLAREIDRGQPATGTGA